MSIILLRKRRHAFLFVVAMLSFQLNVFAVEKSCSDVQVLGAKNYTISKLPDIGKTVSYNFLLGKRQLKLSVFLEQMAWVFVMTDDLGIKKRIPFAVIDYDEKTKWDVLKSINYINIHFFQHDFDFDGIDELVIGLEVKKECTDLNEVAFTVFKYSNNSLNPIRFQRRSDILEYANIVSTQSPLSGFGVSRIEVKGNVINFDRRHRGFFFKYFVERQGISVEYNF
jgi:hypothetical protein